MSQKQILGPDYLSHSFRPDRVFRKKSFGSKFGKSESSRFGDPIFGSWGQIFGFEAGVLATILRPDQFILLIRFWGSFSHFNKFGGHMVILLTFWGQQILRKSERSRFRGHNHGSWGRIFGSIFEALMS